MALCISELLYPCVTGRSLRAADQRLLVVPKEQGDFTF